MFVGGKSETDHSAVQTAEGGEGRGVSTFSSCWKHDEIMIHPHPCACEVVYVTLYISKYARSSYNYLLTSNMFYFAELFLFFSSIRFSFTSALTKFSEFSKA